MAELFRFFILTLYMQWFIVESVKPRCRIYTMNTLIRGNEMKRFAGVPLIMLAMLLMFTLGCEPDDPEDPWPPPNIDHNFGEMTDNRDGQTYKTIQIGTQTWMAQNLNYNTVYRWSWCYDHDINNCNTYGRLYDWWTANSVCPSGWHLPSDAEWTTLTNFLGDNAGGKMKLTGTIWNPFNIDATNESGWSGLPGGNRVSGYFTALGRGGYWWSSTENENYANYAWYRTLNYAYGNLFRDFFYKTSGVFRALSQGLK